ncbi:UNVERIFIED_ORG: AbrB family looped-hinge helix DNA binding protein [Rhizobium esperanzae]|nr:hypothetical protein RHECNPAF_740012 [Rhizobium etli CNPAF512]
MLREVIPFEKKALLSCENGHDRYRQRQVTIPKPVRDMLGIVAGSRVDFHRAADGRVVLVRAVDAGCRALSHLFPLPEIDIAGSLSWRFAA